MKLQHYLGGLEGLPEPLNFETRVFVEEWEKRIFGIHVAMMGLSNHLGSALPQYPVDDVPTAFKDEWTWADLRTGAEAMNRSTTSSSGTTRSGWAASRSSSSTRVTSTEARIGPPKRRIGGRCGATCSSIRSPAIDDQVVDYLREGDSPRRDVAHPKFAVGDRVRITNVPAAAHSRLPGYSA